MIVWVHQAFGLLVLWGARPRRLCTKTKPRVRRKAKGQEESKSSKNVMALANVPRVPFPPAAKTTSSQSIARPNSNLNCSVVLEKTHDDSPLCGPGCGGRCALQQRREQLRVLHTARPRRLQQRQELHVRLARRRNPAAQNFVSRGCCCCAHQEEFVERAERWGDL